MIVSPGTSTGNSPSARADAATALITVVWIGLGLVHLALLGLLEVNPLGQFQRRTPRAASTADPRVTASPGQVTAILKQVSRIRPELTAFFGCLYYAALRCCRSCRPTSATPARTASRPGQDAATAPCWPLAAQTGLRVSELTALRRQDLHLGTSSYLTCTGKGRKERSTPLTPLTTATAKVITAWLREVPEDPAGPVFPGPRGGPLSRDAIRRLVNRHRQAAAGKCPSLKGKNVTPHTLRHSKLSSGREAP